MTGAALYVHVPFCLSKCAYCDFASVPAADETAQAAYLAGVARHLDHWIGRGVFEGGVPSVYIGGGTPTVLGDRLTELVRVIISRTELAPGVEVTVETNPDATDAALIRSLVDAGVNRFSLGVQSFDPATLRFLGRRHDADTAARAAETLRATGVSFSVDLICGVPGLAQSAWSATLRRAVATGADHVSVYPLAVEDGTPLAADVDAGRVPDTDPDTAARDMVLAAEVLGEAGFVRYEVANYARPGHEARHNVGYWTGVPYVGIGPSAAGMLPTPDGGRTRFVFPRELSRWLEGDLAAPDTETLTAEQAAREDVMLRLRLAVGVPVERVEAAGLTAVLDGLAADGLVESGHGAWRTTERGWLLGNEVFERVLFD